MSSENEESSSSSDSDDPFSFRTNKFKSKKARYTDESDDEEEEDEEASQSRAQAMTAKNGDSKEDEVKVTQYNYSSLPAEVISLLDDDDDDADKYNGYQASDSCIPAPTVDISATMQRARQAREALLRAQQNHTTFDSSSPQKNCGPQEQLLWNKQQHQNLLPASSYNSSNNVSTFYSSSLPSTIQPHNTANPLNKGNAITLFLRSSNKNIPVKTYTLEPLQVPLMNDYWQRHGSITSLVSFRFDGQKLNLSNTPQSYDMEDGDLIDVELLPNAVNTARAYAAPPPPQAFTTNTTFSCGTRSTSTAMITLRTRIVHHSKSSNSTGSLRQWQLRKTDCLEKLIQAYRKEKNIISSEITLLLDDKTTKVDAKNSTPILLGLKDYSILEMHVYDSELENGNNNLAAAASSNCAPAATTNSSNTIIRLILRINGVDASKEEYSLDKNDTFQKLHDSFRIKQEQRNKMYKRIKLTLDGSVLSLTDTCINEDLEGGELIDVLCET